MSVLVVPQVLHSMQSGVLSITSNGTLAEHLEGKIQGLGYHPAERSNLEGHGLYPRLLKLDCLLIDDGQEAGRNGKLVHDPIT